MLELKAKKRDIIGKKVKNLRDQGFLPAVIYGEKVQSQAVSIPYTDFEKAYREAGESAIITLDVEGTPYNVLISDVRRDPLKGKPLHADFYAVRMDRALRAKVPLVFTGESSAVKEGGILVKVAQELEVEALPKDLPRELTVDISGLASFEAKLAVRDVPLPAGVKMVSDANDTIVLVEAPRSDEELAALDEKPAESTAVEPELVKTERELKQEKKAAETAATEAAEKNE